MSKRLDETITTPTPDNLIHSSNPATEVFNVKVRKLTEAATYKRGTVLALSGDTGGDGKYVILGTAEGSDETLTANCIIAEDVEVGTTADTVAIAYRTGHFNSNALVTATSYTLTAKDKEALRSGGILISDAVAI